jgi:hypothetical protein
MEQPDWVRMPWKDVGEDERTIHREHSADLGDPGRGIRPVPQRQGGEHQVEHCIRERQLLGLGTDEVHRQLLGVSALAVASICPARSIPIRLASG